MSFRKRNLALIPGSSRDGPPLSPSKATGASLPGVRPSPLDGRPTTSTGTSSLDQLLAGHAGLALGTSLLIEENGTSDYAGALLRYYAAEGLVQGHHVHVVGVPEQWGRALPGLSVIGGSKHAAEAEADKMKIAWRYERLGPAGGIAGSRETTPGRGSDKPDRGEPSNTPATFCHTFDLTKRLEHPPNSTMTFLRLERNVPSDSPFTAVLSRLTSVLAASEPSTIHRCIIPSLLSPALFPPDASSPEHLLPFLHGLRTLLASYSDRLSVMLTLPLSLYPRSAGLVRWIELLSDGLIELSPFPHYYQPEAVKPNSSGSSSQEEQPQGLLKVRRLPIFHERGVGTTSVGEDWAFTLSRRKFAMKPFSLPPIEGETEGQQAKSTELKSKKADMNF